MSDNTERLQFKQELAQTLSVLIDVGKHLFDGRPCRIVTTPDYGAMDGETVAHFDVAIEIDGNTAIGQPMTIAFECGADFSELNDLQVLQQVAQKAALVPIASFIPVVVSAAPFTTGAREFARDKRIVLIRILKPEYPKWMLRMISTPPAPPDLRWYETALSGHAPASLSTGIAAEFDEL